MAIEQAGFTKGRGTRDQISYLRWIIEMSTAYLTAAVAEWLRAWDTLTMFEATACGRS